MLSSRSSPGVCDIEVLKLFCALMETGALHRAASRLDISQPTASRELTRLRSIFNDKLFIKAGTGMVPTSRAVEISPQVCDLLARMETLVAPNRFDPALTHQVFRVASADNGFLIFVGDVMPEFARQAPHGRIEVRQLDTDMFAQLREGLLDLAIFPAQKLPPDLHQRPLMQDENVCLLRRDHPLVAATPPGARPELEAFERYQRVAVKLHWGHETRTNEQIALAEPFDSEPALVAPYFLGVPQMLVETDFLLIVPRPTALRFMRWLPLTTLPTPVPSRGFNPCLIWHDRAHANPAQQWFRSLFPRIEPD